LKARVICLAAVCLGLPGLSVAVTIENGSFEYTWPSDGGWPNSDNGPVGYDGYSSKLIDGWTAYGVDWCRWMDYWQGIWRSADGNCSVDLNGEGPGSISQELNVIKGHTYEVTFYLAGNFVPAPAVKDLDVSFSGSTTPVGQYTFDVTGKGAENMGWEEEHYTFEASKSSGLLTFESRSGGPFGPALDNVSIKDTAAPEPFTLILGASALALGIARRSARKA